MSRWVIALELLILVVLPAGANPSSWQCNLGPYGYTTSVGTAPGASDGVDQLDMLLGVNPYINIAVYHQAGVNGWTGSSGFYSSDIRAPLDMVAGESKTWRLCYWNNSNAPSNWVNTDLTWHFVSGDTDNIEYRLTFVRLPTGMQEWNPPSYASPALGESVLLNEEAEGNWVLWTYRAENGLDGYIFDLTATVVPEPSSLFCLALALSGIGVGALRRRK